MKKYAITIAITLLALFNNAPAASAAEVEYTPVHVIKFSPGGTFSDFITKYTEINAKREHIVVDGECISACTFLLGLVDRSLVCTTDNGWFAFHSAKEPSDDDDGKMVFSSDGNEMFWRMMPADVQTWLTAHDFDYTKPHEKLIFAKATEFVKPCGTP